jgi:uncharacterized protein (TIGR00725 family)
VALQQNEEVLCNRGDSVLRRTAAGRHEHRYDASMSRIIAVVGSGEAISEDIGQHAEHVGRLVAERGWILVTGGKGGVMEAASRGAHRAGGRVVGLLPERDRSQANPHVEISIATGLGEARNAIVATCCDAMIAIGGEYGTLSEIAFALKLGKPVAAISSSWGALPGLVRAENAKEALSAIGEGM